MNYKPDLVAKVLEIRKIHRERSCVNCFFAGVMKKDATDVYIFCKKGHWPEYYTMTDVLEEKLSGLNHRGKCKDWKE